MNVEQLIEELKKQPQWLPVYIARGGNEFFGFDWKPVEPEDVTLIQGKDAGIYL